jgi:hypothetical protein
MAGVEEILSFPLPVSWRETGEGFGMSFFAARTRHRP